MAGNGLVRFEYAPGKFAHMPDYLVPAEKRLELPPVAMPPGLQGPDQRVASNDNAASMLGQASSDFRQLTDASKAPIPGSMLVDSQVKPETAGFGSEKAPSEDAEARLKRQRGERAKELADLALKGDKKTNLKQVAPPDPRRASSVTDTAAERLYGKKPTGTGKPSDDNLKLVAAEQKIERSGGRELLDEYKWKYGLEQRPDLGQELDPDAEQPTWGNEDPITRKRTTGIEKGMALAKASAMQQAEQHLEAQRAQHVSNMGLLNEQAQAIDDNLAAVAERRKKIADLHTLADSRATEARSLEPKTKTEVWESKGAVGQILGALAIAIGGYSQGLGRNGGKNPGWDVINKILDDEVQGGVDKYNRADARHSKAQGEYDRALTLYGDPDAAMLDMRLRKISNVQAMIEQQAGLKGLDQDRQQRIGELGAAAETAYLETVQKLYDQIAGTVTKQEVTLKPYGEVMKSARPAGGGGAGGAAGRGAGATYGMSPEAYAKLTKDNRGLAVKLPNGRFKFARSAEDRKEYQAQINSTTDMSNILRQIQQWRSQKWNTAMWTEKKGQIQAATSRLLELSKKKDMLGALDKGLLDFASKKFGSPEEFTFGSGGEIDGKLSQQITMLQNEQQGVIERDLDDSPLDLTEGGISAAGVEH